MPNLPVKSVSKAEPAPPPIDDRQLRGGLIAWLARTITGTGDARLLFWSWSTMAVVVIVICLLDVMARVHLADLRNLTEPVWQPLVDEYSSGLVIIALFPMAAKLASLATPWDGRALRFWSVHIPGAVAFSLIHVAAIILIRSMVYALFGSLFEFGGFGALFYEMPRDLIAYGLTTGGFWGVMMLLRDTAPAGAATPRAVFDIRDNTRVLRVPIDDILAVRSAGNYVEFLLADGRRPLMRATLAETAHQLTPHGLARTHRSWLVNKRRIAQIEPAGSGDFKLMLGEGVEAPLSRRFKGAIEG
jgi:LytTr DNA-binding domain